MSLPQEVQECRTKLIEIENEMQSVLASSFQEKHDQIKNAVDSLSNILSTNENELNRDGISGETAVRNQDVDNQIGSILRAIAVVKSTFFAKYTPRKQQKKPVVTFNSDSSPEIVTFSGWIHEITELYKLYYRQGQVEEDGIIEIAELIKNSRGVVAHLLQVERILEKIVATVAGAKERARAAEFCQYENLLYLPALRNHDLSPFTETKKAIVTLKEKILRKCSLVFDQWPQCVSSKIPNSKNRGYVTVVLINFEGLMKFSVAPVMRLMMITEHTYWSIQNGANIINGDLPEGFQVNPMHINDTTIQIHGNGEFCTKEMEKMSGPSQQSETYRATVTNLFENKRELGRYRSSAFIATVDLPGIRNDTEIKTHTIAPMCFIITRSYEDDFYRNY